MTAHEAIIRLTRLQEEVADAQLRRHLLEDHAASYPHPMIDAAEDVSRMPRADLDRYHDGEHGDGFPIYRPHTHATEV